MRESKFAEEQISGILNEGEAGRSMGKVARLHGVSRETRYRWRPKHGCREASDAKRLRALVEENRRLKGGVAAQGVNIQVPKDVLGKEWRRWGSPLLTWCLINEGLPDNHKRIRQLYRVERLAAWQRRRQRIWVSRVIPVTAPAPNERWAMDFTRCTLRGNRSSRILNILDVYTRGGISIEIDRRLGGQRVVRALQALKPLRPLPKDIIVD